MCKHCSPELATLSPCEKGPNIMESRATTCYHVLPCATMCDHVPPQSCQSLQHAEGFAQSASTPSSSPSAMCQWLGRVPIPKQPRLCKTPAMNESTTEKREMLETRIFRVATSQQSCST